MSKKDPSDSGAAFGAPWLDRLMRGFNKDSAQQVWLAGLGALARAQAEGTKAFETLAKEGAAWQKRTSTAAEEKFTDMAGRMSDLAGDVQSKAGQRWDQMEGLFEDRTTKMLKRLGVPTAEDIAALNARIDALTAKVSTLTRSAAPKSPAKTAARPAAKKAAIKKTVAKRASRKSAIKAP